jgi:hypothetical protein
MEERKQFTFYRSYFEALSKLPRERRLSALEAVIAYALDGVEPEGLDDMQTMAFLLIRPTLDAGRKMAAGGAKSKVKQRSEKGMAKEGEKEKENENEIENEIENECLWAERFERFWDLYPVKLGKAKAREAWMEILPDEKTACDAVRRWIRSEQWCKEKGRFIPRAAKFLRERHFEDAPMEKVPVGASGILGQAEMEAIARIIANE